MTVSFATVDKISICYHAVSVISAFTWIVIEIIFDLFSKGSTLKSESLMRAKYCYQLMRCGRIPKPSGIRGIRPTTTAVHGHRSSYERNPWESVERYPGEKIRCLEGRVRLYYGISRPGTGERLRRAVIQFNTAPYTTSVYCVPDPAPIRSS